MAVHTGHRTNVMHRILATLGLLAALAAPQPANALFQVDTFTVLGCTFDGNVPQFTSCLTSASANAVKDAEDALKNSPAMAQFGPEMAMLEVLREDEMRIGRITWPFLDWFGYRRPGVRGGRRWRG